VPSQTYRIPNIDSRHPRIRSFHGRQGRLSPTRLEILEKVVPVYLLPKVKTDLRQELNAERVVIDFGAGMGDHTKRLINSKIPVLAIDVHTAGICDMAEYAQEKGFEKLRLFHGDGMECLDNFITPESISEVHVYFPDPWPKVRHHKRRLFNQEFIELVNKVLEPNGKLIFVTDDDSYALQVTEILQDNKKFKIIPFSQEVTLTTYHRRALRLGHNIHPFEMLKI
jgi:tRNA (guanine-N7-)-methyltransferase